MVSTFEAHATFTPAGNPIAVPIPVAPVVVCVIAVSALLIHNVGELEAIPNVLFEETVAANVLAALVPHELVAVTLMFPF